MPLRAWLVPAAFVVSSCSAGGEGGGLTVGMIGKGGTSGGLPPATGGQLVGFDASSRALEVHVENANRVVVEIVTLSCAGECADVVAVARGGYSPYTYVWDDGVTGAARRLCPTSTRAFTVSVTDAGKQSPEFSRSPETRSATVTAEVLGCAGPRADAGPSAGAPGLCLLNPSFEGTVTPNQYSPIDAPPWNSCYGGGLITYAAIGDPSLWPQQDWDFPAAADGRTYLALGVQVVFAGRGSQALCAPIPVGRAFSFLVQLAGASRGEKAGEAPSQVIQVLGGAECYEDEVLWTSPQLTPTWMTYCVTVRPTRPMTSLAFRPQAPSGGEMEGLVDGIVPVERCR